MHLLDMNYEIRKHRIPMDTEESIAGLEDFDEESVSNNGDLPYERPKGSLRQNLNSQKSSEHLLDFGFCKN